MLKVLSLTMLMFIFSCAQTPPAPELDKIFSEKMSDSEYAKLITQNTRGDKQYSGFYNLYQVNATIINSKVNAATLERRAYYQRWDSKQVSQERSQRLQKMSTQTRFFISLYTPERGHNDLERGASMWKTYLEVDGIRYEGKVKLAKGKLVELEHLYPYHNRFSKGYIVTFEIPNRKSEEGKAIFSITSSLGSSDFVYQ